MQTIHKQIQTMTGCQKRTTIIADHLMIIILRTTVIKNRTTLMLNLILWSLWLHVLASDVTCVPLMLCGRELDLLSVFKYLLVCIVASKCFSCSVKNVRMKFIGHLILFTIDRRVQVLNLFLCNCLSHIVCRLFYMRLKSYRWLKARSDYWITVWSRLAKIFNVYNTDSIDFVRQHSSVTCHILLNSSKRDA